MTCFQAADLLLEKAKGRGECSLDAFGEHEFTVKYSYEKVAQALRSFGVLPCPQEIIERYNLNAT